MSSRVPPAGPRKRQETEKSDVRSWLPASLLPRTANEIGKTEDEVVDIIALAYRETADRAFEYWQSLFHSTCMKELLRHAPRESWEMDASKGLFATTTIAWFVFHVQTNASPPQLRDAGA